jgi:hypothetical protein
MNFAEQDIAPGREQFRQLLDAGVRGVSRLCGGAEDGRA